MHGGSAPVEETDQTAGAVTGLCSWCECPLPGLRPGSSGLCIGCQLELHETTEPRVSLRDVLGAALVVLLPALLLLVSSLTEVR